MYCNNCGHKDDDRAKFCASCGAALQLVRENPIRIIGKTEGFLLNPIATFKAVRNGTLRSALLYTFIWFAVLSAFSITISHMFPGKLTLMSIFTPNLDDWPQPEEITYTAIPLICIFGVIGVLIGSLWQQLWVRILGGRQGYTQTVKAISYGATPAYILGWIPYLSVVGLIWAIMVIIIGLRELHSILTIRAIAAWLLGVVSLYIVLVAFILIVLIISGLQSNAWM